MIDVVYIFSKGSPWQNNEIRYSLRSVEKHLKNFRNVFCVGYKPEFLNAEVIEIPHKDIYSNKSRNIMAKIYRACNDARISKNFIVFNDDYFLLSDTSAPDYPFYYNRDLKESHKSQWNSYKKYIESTLLILEAGRKPTLNFDIHRPIIYEKTRFRKMANSYIWNIPFGYVVKSMYCNHFKIPGEMCEDHKINYPYKIKIIEQMNEGKPIFSIGDKALNNEMKAYIMKLYPLKSKFEI